jgi:beta-lactamase superfamily II metal-dependent hydrolase
VAGTGTLEIHQINVGWGGSVLVRGPDGTQVLLEAGNPGMGRSVVVPYLKSQGLSPDEGLDYVIAGHHHCDHIGGLPEMLAAGYEVHIENYDNGSSYTSGCVDAWKTAAARTSAGSVTVPSPGDRIPLGGDAEMTVIAVNGRIIGGRMVSVADENDRSIAVLVQYHGFDYL